MLKSVALRFATLRAAPARLNCRSLSTMMMRKVRVHSRVGRSESMLLIGSTATTPTYFSSSSTASSKTKDDDGPRVVTEMTHDGQIAHVTLNRGNKLNALDMQMFESIAETASSLTNNRSIRVVILKGDGRAFCTGLDVKSIATSGGNPLQSIETLLKRPSPYGDKASNLAQDVAYLWRKLPFPVICVLHGMCFGGGMQIALGADMRYTTPDCQLSIMESKWGLIPDMSASITLRELIPIDIAKELTMTGRILSGEEALQYNLVTKCVEDPWTEADKVAKEICTRSPDSVALTKELYQRTWMEKEKKCLEIESELQRKLLLTWNQMIAAGRNFGLNVPYFLRKKDK